MSSGIKNWHWKQKNVDKWGHEWFRTELPKVTAADSALGLEVKVTSVTAIEGDVTVGQRKSKLITIYDLDVTMAWTGVLADGTEFSGTLHIPEVSHEAIDGLSDYVYEFSSPSTSTPSYAATKKILPPALEKAFIQFQKTLIDVHGKDLTVEVSSEPASTSNSGASTPAIQSSSTTTSTSTTAPKAPAATFNTSTVVVSGRFQIAAADLWDLLTNEAKIPMWSRSNAQFSATPSAPFTLFNGNVHGSVISASPPNQLVQKWALRSPGWPAEHFGTLTTTLEQGSDSTTASFSLVGVPKGHEKEIENNLHAYYIKGLISIGLGSDLSVAM